MCACVCAVAVLGMCGVHKDGGQSMCVCACLCMCWCVHGGGVGHDVWG